MNERIYELAEQAGFENGHQDRYGNSLSQELEKFAELIVKECADIATLNQFQWDSAGGYVLEHFGVEE
ncbi:hypothetical protein UFOVP907_2 [uncultured Caudovirales phage]|uniref:Uncharacterized protein n=1 Tax=uncultured Caudovirales phage TaxID=2100421 RepID=A0A6J5PQ97_9CAUD|nr:hypothetical protein UFOVP907_2 [uncultured Caudovirales phage]